MPVDVVTLILFAGAALGLALTPGPDMLYVLTRAIAQGRKAGLVSVIGVMCGCLIHASAAALGLSELFRTAPLAYDAVRVAGAVYLLWLAWQALKPGSDVWHVGAGIPALALAPVFRQALWTNLLNPKVALFYLALFPQFIRPAHGAILVQALILTLIFVAIGLSVNGGVALIGGRFGDWMTRHPRFARVQQRLMGVIFIALAVRLLVAGRD